MNKSELGHWACFITIPDNPYGFIYEITNLLTDQKYIGKKQILAKRKSPPRKGKKNKKSKIVQTDWQSYTGSSKELNTDIQKYGKDNFRFEILEFCSCKWELGYREMIRQIEAQVLLSDQYYNGIINCRLGKIPKKLGTLQKI